MKNQLIETAVKILNNMNEGWTNVFLKANNNKSSYNSDYDTLWANFDEIGKNVKDTKTWKTLVGHIKDIEENDFNGEDFDVGFKKHKSGVQVLEAVFDSVEAEELKIVVTESGDILAFDAVNKKVPIKTAIKMLESAKD